MGVFAFLSGSVVLLLLPGAILPPGDWPGGIVPACTCVGKIIVIANKHPIIARSDARNEINMSIFSPVLLYVLDQLSLHTPYSA